MHHLLELYVVVCMKLCLWTKSKDVMWYVLNIEINALYIVVWINYSELMMILDALLSFIRYCCFCEALCLNKVKRSKDVLGFVFNIQRFWIFVWITYSIWMLTFDASLTWMTCCSFYEALSSNKVQRRSVIYIKY